MRTSIPEFARQTSPLQELLKVPQVTMQVTEASKLAGLKFTSDVWNHKINSSSYNVNAAIRESIQISHSDQEKLVCLFSDASENQWETLLTQVPKAYLAHSVLVQDHQPLAVLSRSFNGSQRRWNVIGKEAFLKSCDSSSSGRISSGTTFLEVLHFDFISIHPLYSKSNHIFAYVLILKDDLSGFVELIPSSSPDYFVVADALMDWYRRFGFPQYLVSNQESGFRDQDFRDFNRIMETNHQFVTTYPP